MKWKRKEPEYNTDWHDFFAIIPRRTEDNWFVMLQTIERRYKVHMTGGNYIYKLKE